MSKDIVLKAKEICRHLRKNQTEAEKRFWETVRRRNLLGLKFYRQFPIFFTYDNHLSFFIADFYCARKRFVVEIDGRIHDYTQDRDQFRDHIINTMDISVLRFTNNEILENTEAVLDEIVKSGWAKKSIPSHGKTKPISPSLLKRGI